MKSKLSSSAWGHAIVYALSFIILIQNAYEKYLTQQLVHGREPNIFGCAIYMPIALPERTKMGPQRRMETYIGLECPSIIILS